MSNPQLPEVTLQDNDWDFSGCPVGELFDCWVYEFAREYHRRHGKIPGIWRIWFPIGADFPQTPYLSVSRVNPSEEVVVSEEDRKRFSEYFEKHPEAVSHSGDRFTINWRHSDRALVECFKRLLKDKRPRPPAQGKGRPKELGADLKRLGAFRLLDTANLSIAQAMAHSASHRKGAINIPLYVNHADWSKGCLKPVVMCFRFPAIGSDGTIFRSIDLLQTE